MEPYVAFLIDHWMLSSAFVIIVILLLMNEGLNRSFGIKALSPQELVNFLNHKNAKLVDIRTREQFNEKAILGAINIPQGEFTNQLNTLEKYKDKPVILVCQRGNISPKIGRLLKKHGFADLYYLAGGIEMWQSNGMPILKK